MPLTHCIGISSVVTGWLQQGLQQPVLLARFDQVINIAVRSTIGPEVLALCSRRVGYGPLNVIVEPWPDWTGLDTRTHLKIDPRGIQVGEVYIDCAGAVSWNPRPDWGSVTGSLQAVGLDRLRRAAVVSSGRSQLLAVVCDACPVSAPGGFLQALQLLEIWARWRDEAALSAAVAALAGLGPGLTPSGDDFLCGLMLGLWATRPAPQRECNLIASVATPLTTSLSAAFLRRAAAGQVTAAWMDLLHGLATTGGAATTAQALAAVMAWGHSSGADTLAGFLWLCNSTLSDCVGTSQCA